MDSLFLWCAVIGGAILVVQVVLSLFGIDGDVDAEPQMEAGLDLISVRSITAAVAFFGVAGLASSRLGLPGIVAFVVGAAAGTGAAVLVAIAMRSFRRLESDGSVRVEQAIGLNGKVYLTVPGSRDGIGKVHVAVGGRTQEYRAVTRGESLPTGAPVTVVDILDANTVEVASPIQLQGESSV